LMTVDQFIIPQKELSLTLQTKLQEKSQDKWVLKIIIIFLKFLFFRVHSYLLIPSFLFFIRIKKLVLSKNQVWLVRILLFPHSNQYPVHMNMYPGIEKKP
jgi:hypothetical protein